MTKTQREQQLQIAVTEYINFLPPIHNFVFHNSERGGFKLNSIAAKVKYKALQCGKNRLLSGAFEYKPPDFCLIKRGQPNMLYLEFKADCPYKKDGTLYKDIHLEAQAETLKLLNDCGHTALFCWSSETAEILINKFLLI